MQVKGGAQHCRRDATVRCGHWKVSPVNAAISWENRAECDRRRDSEVVHASSRALTPLLQRLTPVDRRQARGKAHSEVSRAIFRRFYVRSLSANFRMSAYLLPPFCKGSTSSREDLACTEGGLCRISRTIPAGAPVYAVVIDEAPARPRSCHRRQKPDLKLFQCPPALGSTPVISTDGLGNRPH